MTAAPARGDVRLQVLDASGKKQADAKAPAPAADVVHVDLSAGPPPARTGALARSSAATDASECRSFWRYHAGKLARVPLRDAAARTCPTARRPGEWTWSWQREADDRPSVLVRERTQHVESGVLRVREAFAFAGFSLDADPPRSGAQINGVPIPSWYGAIFYARPALEILYGRFDLSRMRAHPMVSVEADRQRGVFALHFVGPDAERTIPVEASETQKGKTVLTAGADGKTMRATVSLGGDGSVPYELEIEGLGAPLDQIYAPAGGWRGESRTLFLSAADEIVSKGLAGTWQDPANQHVVIAADGVPPYQVRLDKQLYTPVMAGGTAPLDVLLLPSGPSGRPLGIVLRGPNTLESVPLTCPGTGAAGCRADGPGVKLRRLGARMNAR